MSEVENQEPDEDIGGQNTSMRQNSEGTAKNTDKSISRRLSQWNSKFKKNKMASKTLVKAISKILISGGWVILAFIIVVGIIMFLLTMPGMVMEKIKGLFKAIGDAWSSWWGEDSAEQFKQCQVYQVVDYLDEMGYDLKGYGIVTEFLTNPDTQYDKGGAEKEPESKKSTADGVIRDENNDVVTAKSEFINTYLISENYIYTIKNFNVDTNTGWDAFWNHVSALFSATSSLSNRSGMLVFWHDTGEIGERDGAYGASERGYIKFDPDSRKLLIKKGWTNSAMAYSLDGWTGRYGMPVDFLLTIHLATQMPDLAYDMATHFNTEVNILLHESAGSVYGSYKTANGYVTYEAIMTALDEYNDTGVVGDVLSFFDNLTWTAKEMSNIHALGVEPPGGCDCTKTTAEEPSIRDSEGNVKILAKDDDGYYYTVFIPSYDPMYPGTTEKKYVPEEQVTFGGEIKSVGTNCKDYVKFIVNKMKKSSDDSYKTYTPYIESVQDHWYRDVYFVEKSTNDKGNSISGFVDYDYQYELITGERWTLYETDENGDFVYYLVNDDGSMGARYDGIVTSGEKIVQKKNEDGKVEEVIERQASRGENGEAVIKKAKTINLSEKYEDLGWKENGSGHHIAYDPDVKEPTPSYDAMYSDEEIAAEGEALQQEAMKHLYIEVKITNVTQTGEGLRTETNPDIKKMFLTNNYFKYDGSRQRAEIIYALREKSGVGYGPIEDGKLDTEYQLTFEKPPTGIYTSDAKNGTYKIRDYVGNVSFQQDALNTFAMLENSHTADADYIYKDFKELVVELGYFKKEELIKTKPKLLEWIVPEIGSGGYPMRSIDKLEGEYGTLVHSKMDIDANAKSTIMSLIMEGAAREDTDAPSEEGELASKDTETGEDVEGIKPASRSRTPMANFTAVGALASVAPADVQEEDPPSGGNDRHVIDYIFNGIRYEGWKQTKSTCTLNAFAFIAAAYTGESNEFYLTDSSGNMCSLGSGVSNAYWNDNSYFQGFGTVDIPGTSYSSISSEFEEAVAQAFSESIPVYFFSGFKSSKGNHAVTLLGTNESGKILYYNPASGVIEEYGSGSSFEANLHALLYTGANEQGGHFYNAFIPDEPPAGVKKQAEANAYKGFEGNEAVVSPVTGILMEYGTYTEEEAEENRVNLDLKYKGLLEGYTYEEEIVTDPETGEETKEIKYPSDKVGYAVIKVLDAETYKKLESTVTNKWKDATASLIKVNEKSTDYEAINKHVSFNEATEELIDENRDDLWSKIDETVYGYKEFAEQYEQFGIGGYYVYIDGFKCETVDESLTSEEETGDSGEESDANKVIPQGEELTFESFKILESEVSDESYEPETTSLYEPDEISKLMSKEYTEKLKAESEIKADASIGITFEFEDTEIDAEGNTSKVMNEYVLIKEGTVLGRTLTDYELLEGEDFRNGKYGTYDEYKEVQEKLMSGDLEAADEVVVEENENGDLVTKKIPLVGNYLRIIMQKTDSDIVENVEDYMKLDEGKKRAQNDWELFYWLPFESGGTDKDGCGPESQGTCSDGETAVGIIQWTVLLSSNMNNIASQFIPGCLEQDSALCAPLSAYASWSAEDFWNDYKSGGKAFQGVLSQICDADRDAFLNCQMEVAKKQYLEPILEKYPWLESRPSCVQGEIMHLSVWGAKWDWVGGYESKSDQEIIEKVRNTIANTGSTAGAATGDESSGRAYNEPQIGLEILKGSMSADDVEQWVRTGDASILPFDWK